MERERMSERQTERKRKKREREHMYMGRKLLSWCRGHRDPGNSYIHWRVLEAGQLFNAHSLTQSFTCTHSPIHFLIHLLPHNKASICFCGFTPRLLTAEGR